MFGFLKKKQEEVKKEADNTLYAVCNGQVIPIEQVQDPVFSQKMMGDGFAVIPTDGAIFSPVSGKVVSVFLTKHAIGLKMDNGLEVLLHMGIDTVELAGAPFEIKIKDGDSVGPTTQVAQVDLAALATAEKSNEMMVIITNMDAVDSFSVNAKENATAGEAVGSATAK